MRIDHLEITNFKACEHLELDFHPQFNLLVGRNGSGKTSILEALAVALGILHVPHSTFGWRKIEEYEIYRKPTPIGARTTNGVANSIRMVPAEFAQIGAIGTLDGKGVRWKRQIPLGGRRMSNKDAREAVAVVNHMLNKAKQPFSETILPVVAYFSAERLGKESPSRGIVKSTGGRDRMDAYADCLFGSVRQDLVREWLVWNQASKGSNGEKPQHRAVINAIKHCLPGWKDFYVEEGSRDVVINLEGKRITYSCLSAGQKLLLSMAADIAIRAETLNPHLGKDAVLKTPGIVLIDELENHLHPAWQRNVVKSLIEAFPAIQFVCSTHSPQIIGEVDHEMIKMFSPTSQEWETPGQSFGMDSNWILSVLMDASEMDKDTMEKVENVKRLALDKRLEEAQAAVAKLRARIGNSEQIQAAASTIERVKILGR